MKYALTERQNDIYKRIEAYIIKNNHSPTFKEIAVWMDCTPSGVHDLVTQLVKKGWLGRQKYKQGFILMDSIEARLSEIERRLDINGIY